jgi:hypothetical protein
MQAFRDCPVRCEVVHDAGQADVLSSLVNPSHRRRTDQAIAIITMESFHGHSGHNIGTQEEQASDFILSYNRKADVWTNYFYGKINIIQSFVHPALAYWIVLNNRYDG